MSYRGDILSVRLPDGAEVYVVPGCPSGSGRPPAYWLQGLPPCTLAQARRLLASRHGTRLPVRVTHLNGITDMVSVAVCLTPGEATALANGEDWRPLLGLHYPLRVVAKAGEEGWLDGR